MHNQLTWDTIFEKFKKEHPGLRDMIINWAPSGGLEIPVYLSDNTKVYYDYITERCVRMKHVEDEDMTEQDYREVVAYRIKTYMIRKGITQSDLAERMGVVRSTVRKWIDAKSTPSAYNVRKMSIIFKCSPNEIVNPVM